MLLFSAQGREEFCAVDEKTGKPIILSVAEKERIFVDALQAYFFDGREVMRGARALNERARERSHEGKKERSVVGIETAYSRRRR